MTGNGFNPTYKKGDDAGMVYDIVLTTLLTTPQIVIIWQLNGYPPSKQPFGLY